MPPESESNYSSTAESIPDEQQRPSQQRTSLAALQRDLERLENGTLPELLRKCKKIKEAAQEREMYSRVLYELECERIDLECEAEAEAIELDYSERCVELKETLTSELKERRRQIEHEQTHMEVNSSEERDRPPPLKKLRPRYVEPSPSTGDKRRRQPQGQQVNTRLLDEDIADDMKIFNKLAGKSKRPAVNGGVNGVAADTISGTKLKDVKIVDERLYYEKGFYDYGRSVIVESRESGRQHGVITSIAQNEIFVKLAACSNKLRITVSHLQRGRYVLKKRNLAAAI